MMLMTSFLGNKPGLVNYCKRKNKEITQVLELICQGQNFLLVDLREFFSDLGSGEALKMAS